MTGSRSPAKPVGETPPHTQYRRTNDIAFSGNGEPTTYPELAEAIQLAADLKRSHELDEVKTVLITNASHLARPSVIRGLEVMDAANGKVWAKLDAIATAVASATGLRVVTY